MPNRPTTSRARQVVQKGRDYAGIAAMITAIGGIMGLYWQNYSHRGESENVQKSVLAVMQYRLGIVERYCLPPELGGINTPTPPPETPPPVIVVPEEPIPAESLDSVESFDVVESPPEPDPPPPEISNPAGESLKRKVISRKEVTFDELRDYVQKSGRAISQEDFDE